MSKLTFLAWILVAGSAFLAPPATAEPGDGWIGIVIGETRASVENPADPKTAAVRIAGVFEGSPAEIAGLRAKDWILAVDGVAVATSQDLVRRVRELGADAWVQVLVERSGQERTVTMRLGARTEDGMPRSGLVRGWIGVKTLDLPPTLRSHFGAPRESGVMIAEIAEGSPAEAAGFDLGDVVFSVDGEPVGSTGDLGRLVAGSGVGNEVEFEVARGGAVLVLEALIGRAPEIRDLRP